MGKHIRFAAAVVGAMALTGCAPGEPAWNEADTPVTPRTVVSTVTDQPATTAPAAETTSASGAPPPSAGVPASSSWEVGIPGSRFVGEIADVPATDPSPFESSLIFPAQPGLQFQGPDGTYCEMYGADDPAALCTHQGEGDVNAVSVRQGEPATTHNVNRIFAPHEQTRVLEPGSRLVDGPVSCAVPAGDVRVMCAIDFYSFAVSQEGVELS